MKMTRWICAALALLALSCADSGGPVTVDTQWNLTCPSGGAAGCGALAENTCLGSVGQRVLVGDYRQTACTGDQIIAICEALERSDGKKVVTLEASVGGDFGFELSGATIGADDGSLQAAGCNVTIIEDGLPYDLGRCGSEPPSMEQPCQLSDISLEDNEISFGLECASLLSSTTDLAFDVGAVGGGPTTIRFANCAGL